MNYYFNIKYEFDYNEIHRLIDVSPKGYICVADGTIMRYVHKDMEYRKIVNNSLFSISDSSWTPIFLKWIYGIKVDAYPGPQLFLDVIKRKKYRMFFMGSNQRLLNSLKTELSKIDSNIADMSFYELPFCKVEDFDYKSIAKIVNDDRPHIIWVALGAPKQEIFMSKLAPYLHQGIQIAVGAAFTFYSGLSGTKRAPEWVRKMKLEFLYRVFQEPRKQGRRSYDHVKALPSILKEEYQKSKIK